MKFICLSFLLLIVTPIVAQKNWEQALLDAYEREKYEQVIQLADSLEKSASEINIARLHQIKADAFYFLNDIQSSLDNYLKAIENLGDFSMSEHRQLECYSHAGFCYKYLGKPDEAIPFYHEALKLAQNLNEPTEIATQKANLGSLYREIGNYQKALEFLNGAYQIDFDLNDKVAIAYDQVSLSELMIEVGDHRAAIGYLKEGLSTQETKENDHTPYMLRVGKLSRAYLINNQLDSAKKYNYISICEAKRLNSRLDEMKFTITKAGIFHAFNRIDSASLMAKQAHSYFEGKNNRFEVEAGLQLAQVSKANGNLETAKRLLEKAIQIATDNSYISSQEKILSELASVNEDLGLRTETILSLKSLIAVRDTLIERKKQYAILVLDQEFQKATNLQQIELLETRDTISQLQLERRRRDIWLLMGLSILLVLVGALIIILQKRKNRLKNELLTSQVNELRLQIGALMEGATEGMDIKIDTINEELPEPLSDREFEILNYAISELSNTEIADKAFVSVNTVKFHLKNIYLKLGVTNRKEALKYAIQSSSN